MGLAIGIIGGLVSAAGSVMAGQQQAAQYEYQAKVAEQNSQLAKARAQESLEEGAREQLRFTRRARQFQSSQLTQLAGSGLQISGSPLNVLQDTAMGIEEDTQQIRYNALKNMWGNEMDSANYLSQASQARAAASNAKRSGMIGAATGLIGVGASIYGSSHSTYSGGDSIAIGTGAGAVQRGADTYVPSGTKAYIPDFTAGSAYKSPFGGGYQPGLINQQAY